MVEDKKNKLFYGYIIVAVIFLIGLIAHGVQYTFGIFLKPILAELDWTRAATSGAFSLYLILWGVSSIFVGRLNDKFGPRVVMTICGFSLGLGYLLMSQISAVWQLYLFYGVMIAIGMSGTWVPLISTVPRWFVKRRGMMTGIVTSGAGIGTILFSLVASQLIAVHGWRLSYIMVGAGVLALLILVAQFLRRDPHQVGQLPYGGSEEVEDSLRSLAGGLCFREAIGTRSFWLVCAAYFCFGFNHYTIMVHIVPHAIELGISPMIAASIIAVIGGVNTVGRIGIGSAGDRIGNKRSLIISFILMTAALLWVTVAKEMWMFYLFAVVFGLGYGGLGALMSPVPAELFGLRSLGTIVGAVMFSFTIGGAIGPVLAGRIFDITGSYNSAFMTCTAVGITGIIVSALLRPLGGQGGANDARRGT